MAGIPQNFQEISNVIPTYQFIDLAAGTGFISFYAGKTVDLNLLSNYQFYSDNITTYASIPQGSYELIIDNDFDVVFNRPINISGLTILNIPIGLTGSQVNCDINSYIVVTLKKWDGVTETTIATNQTTQVNMATNGSYYYMTATDLNIPLTHIKIGETLRLTLECYAKYNHAVGGTQNFILGHDPKSRTTGWDTTGAVPSQLVLQLPVRLNL